jgi:hypothetical protein
MTAFRHGQRGKPNKPNQTPPSISMSPSAFAPAYHLIANGTDVINSQHNSALTASMQNAMIDGSL